MESRENENRRETMGIKESRNDRRKELQSRGPLPWGSRREARNKRVLECGRMTEKERLPPSLYFLCFSADHSLARHLAKLHSSFLFARLFHLSAATFCLSVHSLMCCIILYVSTPAVEPVFSLSNFRIFILAHPPLH